MNTHHIHIESRWYEAISLKGEHHYFADKIMRGVSFSPVIFLGTKDLLKKNNMLFKSTNGGFSFFFKHKNDLINLLNESNTLYFWILAKRDDIFKISSDLDVMEMTLFKSEETNLKKTEQAYKDFLRTTIGEHQTKSKNKNPNINRKFTVEAQERTKLKPVALIEMSISNDYLDTLNSLDKADEKKLIKLILSRPLTGFLKKMQSEVGDIGKFLKTKSRQDLQTLALISSKLTYNIVFQPRTVQCFYKIKVPNKIIRILANESNKDFEISPADSDINLKETFMDEAGKFITIDIGEHQIKELIHSDNSALPRDKIEIKFGDEGFKPNLPKLTGKDIKFSFKKNRYIASKTLRY